MFRSGNEQNDVTATNGADVEASLSLAAVDSGRLLKELPISIYIFEGSKRLWLFMEY